jgi:peptidyl-prolyl cis-trans isomerase B (cyclophilin B)
MPRLIATLATVLCFGLPLCAQAAAPKPQVQMETSMGVITIELEAKAAPQTVANFLNYVRAGFYDGTIFHRVIKSFMIQGGGFTPQMQQKATRPPVANEADNGLKNNVGTIAMARTNVPDSATSQFFINVKDNDFLNHTAKTARGWGYCVFGRVIKGMEVVHQIETLKTTVKSGYGDVPVEPVLIKSAVVLEMQPENKTN